jgi:hypothetical protein
MSGRVWVGISQEMEDAPVSSVTVKTAPSMMNQAEPEM